MIDTAYLVKKIGNWQSDSDNLDDYLFRYFERHTKGLAFWDVSDDAVAIWDLMFNEKIEDGSPAELVFTAIAAAGECSVKKILSKVFNVDFKIISSAIDQAFEYRNYFDNEDALMEMRKEFFDTISNKEDDFLNIKNFSTRVINCLKSEGILTIGDLLSKSEIDLRKITNLGDKSIREIEMFLSDNGLSLRPL